MNQKENMRQKQDLRVLMEHFDNGQMDRYEAFRRSGLTKSAVRKVPPSRPSPSLQVLMPSWCSSSTKSCSSPSLPPFSPSCAVSPKFSWARLSRRVRSLPRRQTLCS